MLQANGFTDEISQELTDLTLDALTSRKSHFEARIEGIPTSDLAREAMRLRTRMLARPVRAWHRVNRATFFPGEHANTFIGRALRAETHAPLLTKTAECISDGLRSAGSEFGAGAESLASYDMSRIGINYMKGSRDEPAKIPDHYDPPEELGAVVVLTLQHSVGTVICGENIHVVFGADVCKNLGMFHYEHGVTSNSLRVSATIADLRI